jgi:hypothetical protein
MATSPITSGSSTPVNTSLTDEGKEVRRGGSLDRQPRQAPAHEALLSRGGTESMRLPGAGESTERPRRPLDALKTATSQESSSTSKTEEPKAKPTEHPLQSSGTGRQPVLTRELTFSDNLLDKANTSKLQGKKLSDEGPLLETGERSHRFDTESTASKSSGAFKNIVLEGNISKRQGKRPVGEDQLLKTEERSKQFDTHSTSSKDGGGHLVGGGGEDVRRPSQRSFGPENKSVTASQTGSSGSSRRMSSAGVGERRPTHSFRDPTTGSQPHTPWQSERFSFPSSGEQQMTGVIAQALPLFGTPPESSRGSSGSGSPPRAATWRETVSALARTVGQQAVQTASVGTVLQPNSRLLKAAAGHLAHQAVSVGIPTFAREMLAQGLMVGLHRASPQLAVGMQAGMMVMNITLQVVRERREARVPDEAARGFHALSAEQWGQSSHQDQNAMRETQTKHSRLLTVLQVASSAVNLGLGIANVRSGDASSAIQRVATDVKTAVYATMRDALQASFSMVGIEGTTHGTSGPHLTAAIATYAGVQAASNYVSDAMLAAIAPERSTATAVLNGVLSPAVAGMSTSAAWGTALTVAGAKAALNTVVEAIDWFQRTQHEASQGGTIQRLDPLIPGFPRTQPEVSQGGTVDAPPITEKKDHDYGRLLDHTPGRMAIINSINAASGLAGHFAQNSSDALKSLIGNVGSATVTFLTDYTISNTWQADSAVRAATSRGSESHSGSQV